LHAWTPRCAQAQQAPLEDDLLGEDEIAEEVYSLEADSYHSDADDFDELGGDSDKSGGEAQWVRARARHPRPFACRSSAARAG
jgi:hypothetical protein